MIARVIVFALMLLAGNAFAADKGVWDSVFQFQSRLAKEGNAEAQFKLGEMYEEGRGTPQDDEVAKQWYKKAANQGHAKAEARLKALPEKRKREQLARQQAQREAEAAKQRALAEEQARQEAEAAARKRAADDKARREALAKKRAADEQARREALAKKRAAEKRAAEEKARKAAADKALARERAAEKQSAQAAPEKKGKPKTEKAEKKAFETDPCKGPTAKFLSTCRGR